MINWRNLRRVHFTGIKGVGMTALACCLKDLGIKVSGSDTDEVFVTDKILEEKKIPWHKFSQEKITSEIDLLIFTGAHQGEENPEVKKAEKLKIQTLTQGEALGELMKLKPTSISVCGVGGKTTTTAMIATLLEFLNGHPSYAVGVGMIDPLGLPGKFDKKGKIFVAEADEYVASPNDPTPKFFYQNPQVIVLTNLEYDHPDVYRRFSETKAAFKTFAVKLTAGGLLLAPADSENSRAFIEELEIPVQTFGFSPGADWQIKNYRETNKGAVFSLRYQKLFLEDIQMAVPGRFNALNAVASLAVTNFLGFSLKDATSLLKKFKGTKRRFEFIEEIQGRKLFDDYAHHPKQLKATLEAAKKTFKRGRLWAIFQSHTFSRTKALFSEFTQSFNEADFVIITPIYASAREKRDQSVSGKILAKAIAQFHPRAFYVEKPAQLAELLKEKSQVNDIIFTLGAGDIFQWHKVIKEALKNSKSLKESKK